MLNELEKKELLELTELLEIRKKDYWIIWTKLQEHQNLLKDAIVEKKEVIMQNGRLSYFPKNKYILFQWWNGSWKTMTWIYLTVLLALWRSWEKYWLPYIWEKQDIWIVTKSWANITSTIWPYLIWEFSKTRIPKDEVEKVNSDNWIIKSIKLKNWCIISIRTYDQWPERLQGWSPDFILVDEEPTQKSVWEEILARWRKPNSQIVLTMTPLNWLTPVYEYFYEQKDDWVKSRSKVILVSSLDNKFADHTWLMWLSEQDKKMRIYWMFVPPSWLVYSSFNRAEHTIKFFDPKDLWYDVSFYWAIDFWHTHPTAFLSIAVDWDWNIYVFDILYKSWMLIKDIVEWIKRSKIKHWIEYEYIVADTAAKREREELLSLWIRTRPADKWSKWESWESNRKAGIFKINQLLSDGKIYIADTCRELITEFEQHHYKDWKKDWEVEKTQDDALDAFRYWVFSYKPKTTKQIVKEWFRKQYGVAHSKYNYYEQLHNNPY